MWQEAALERAQHFCSTQGSFKAESPAMDSRCTTTPGGCRENEMSSQYGCPPGQALPLHLGGTQVLTSPFPSPSQAWMQQVPLSPTPPPPHHHHPLPEMLKAFICLPVQTSYHK